MSERSTFESRQSQASACAARAVRIGPVRLALADQQEAVRNVLDALQTGSPRVFAFCNMHTHNLARRSRPLADALSQATVFNDGVGMDLASLILFGRKFPANLNGTDLTPAVLGALSHPTNVYLVGSPPGVAQQAAAALEARFPCVRVVGTQHGFFDAGDSEQLVQEIRAAGTELLLLGMGNPRQELWAAEFSGRTGAVTLCVGAFLDFSAGRVPRAPLWVRKMRAEWVYRMAQEPSRLWRRYIGGAMPFLSAVLRERLTGTSTSR